MTTAVGILGAGRQAIETSGYCRELGIETAFFIEEEPPKYDRDTTGYGAPIVAYDDAGLVAYADYPVISAVGSPSVRQRLVDRWPGDRFMTLVSDVAWLAGDVSLGRGSTIGPRAAVNRCVEIGEHVLVNVGAILSHDVVVGPHCTISPGSTVGGCARLGAGVFLGIGATVIDHVTIGDGAYVAAGAVVVSDVNPHETVIGVPARPRNQPSR